MSTTSLLASVEELENVVGLLRLELKRLREHGADVVTAEVFVRRLELALAQVESDASGIHEKQQELDSALDMQLERFEDLAERAELLEGRLAELDDRLRAVEGRGGAAIH
jgi:chromosome segregation ATPase